MYVKIGVFSSRLQTDALTPGLGIGKYLKHHEREVGGSRENHPEWLRGKVLD